MFIYYIKMRNRDDSKKAAIIRSTVKLVNEIGFVSSSVSKIAGEANVSPATIYIYYKNKEDLLVSTYIDIKRELSWAILEGFEDSLPIRDILRDFWLKAFEFISKNPENFQYTEQFASSPYSELVNQAEVEKYFDPMIKIIKKGIAQKIIKEVPLDVIQIFIFNPVMNLANSRLCSNVVCGRDTIEEAFTMAWDAIKL